MNILVTGGTGFLGRSIIDLIKNYHEHQFYLLTRKIESQYLNEFIKDYSHIQLVQGDITRPDIFFNSEVYDDMIEKIEVILHAAAYYDLQGSYSSCFMYNIVGTQNILFFAKKINRLKSFHYVSTVAVAGDYSGRMPEKFLDLGQKFSNHYAKTKADAEKLVRDSAKNLPQIRIYRLGILIGDTKTGFMDKLDGPYYFTNAFYRVLREMPLARKVPVLLMPYSPDSLLPIIPVDLAASFVTHALLNVVGDDPIKTYHVVSDQCPDLKSLLTDILDMFGMQVQIFGVPKNQALGPIFKALKLPTELIEYMYAKTTYDRQNVMTDFPEMKLGRYSEYKKVFLEGALAREKMRG
ncbi:MAG: hypothetical protein Fur0010_28850 [Bdellovibrio sp.]